MAVHSAFAVPVTLYRKAAPREAVILQYPLTARLHNRVAVNSDPLNGGYASIVEGVTRAIFNRQELEANGIALQKDDIISFDAPYNVRVRLATKDPANGPVVEKWSVEKR